jgi:pyruvate formate lyase activating enzyme
VLELGGFLPLSTVDWPGRLAAVAFVQGCPWRCGYCHNPELQRRGRRTGPAWSSVLETLGRRVGLLDGVVFSGGEPTTDPRLAQAVSQVRALGLEAGLHTAGIYPERLAALLPDLAWVGFDIKTDFAAYEALTQRRRSGEATRRSLEHLLASGVACEIRTTYHPALIGGQALLDCARALKALGVRDWVLQRWRPRDDTPAAEVDGWHWPGEAMMQALRATGPSLTLR